MTVSVLITANAFYGSTGSLSGGDKRFIEIFKRLARSGHFHIELITTPAGCDAALQEGMKNVAFHHLPATLSGTPGGIALDYATRTLYAIGWGLRRHSRFDILYNTTHIITDVVPGFLLRLLDRPKPKWVVTVFHLIPHPSRRAGSWVGNWLSFSQQWLSLQLIRYADLIIVDNSFVKRELIGLGLHEHRIRILPAGGIDPALIERAANSDDRYDAVFLGRLHPSKGVFDLPKIWAKVCTKRPGSRLGIIGGGSVEIRDALAQAIAEAGLSGSIMIHGSLDTEHVYSLLKSAHIFVFPSYEEGWGIAICEAMACGLPVVAYALPVYAEVFGNVVQTVPIKDFSAMAAGVVRLLSDDAMRHSLAKLSIEVARQYTWDSLAEQEEALLSRLN